MASPFLSPYTSGEPATEPLLITVRFSASIPDLQLDVPEPETTTGAAPPSQSRSPRPAADHSDDSETPIDNGKGKQAVRDTRPRLYIHCSIGDIALSEADVANEASVSSTILLQQKQKDTKAGAKPPAKDVSPLLSTSAQSRRQSQSQARSTTTPAPRGFDRLLSAGFTPAEVTALRSQFLAVQSVSRTPDTMPSGDQLRDLEDRWMDEGSTAAQVQGLGGDGGGGGDDEGGLGAGSRGAMDDMLWGAVMGFFWPVGCAMWLRREEGVWSWRKGVAVCVGVLVNASFGAMRIMN
ncbi:hypothetical protein N7475_002011 [Penicillium sp. IBT 31633x]|nr:hypothetical protein N7475_002011 [Penicillium sp. IBT 31633x]